MHNKLFVADNALAITGGRNIGDAYFTRDQHSNFIDLDVVAAGPIVPELSASFDEFWNSKYAFPIASIASPENTAAAAAAGGGARNHGQCQLAGARARCAPGATRLGAGHRAGGSAGEDRQRSRPDEEVTIANDITALMKFGKSGTHHHFSVLRAGQGRRRTDSQTR